MAMRSPASVLPQKKHSEAVANRYAIAASEYSHRPVFLIAVQIASDWFIYRVLTCSESLFKLACAF